MRCTRQSVEIVVAEILDATPVRQTRPISDAIVGVGGLVDGRSTGPQLVENLLDLRSGIIPEALCKSIVG